MYLTLIHDNHLIIVYKLYLMRINSSNFSERMSVILLLFIKVDIFSSQLLIQTNSLVSLVPMTPLDESLFSSISKNNTQRWRS